MGRLNLLSLALALTAASLAAQPIQPTLFAFQGRLLDSDGVPITTTTEVGFRLYEGGDANTAGAGTLVFSEIAQVTPDATGIFSHSVGSAASPPVDAGVFSTTEPLWLQINVPAGGDALLPRTAVVAVPRALAAESALTLTPATEEVVIPILNAGILYGGTADPSDDMGQTFGIRLDNANNMMVADGLLPSSYTGAPASIRITAEILGALPGSPSQRSVLFTFRLNGLESGAVWIFESPHEFSGTGPETFALSLAASGGTFIPGEAVSWTIGRKWNFPTDTLPGSVLLLAGRMSLSTTR